MSCVLDDAAVRTVCVWVWSLQTQWLLESPKADIQALLRKDVGGSTRWEAGPIEGSSELKEKDVAYQLRCTEAGRARQADSSSLKFNGQSVSPRPSARVRECLLQSVA